MSSEIHRKPIWIRMKTNCEEQTAGIDTQAYYVKKNISIKIMDEQTEGQTEMHTGKADSNLSIDL